MRSLSSPNDISVLKSLASPIKCQSLASTLVNKITGRKNSSHWLSTVGRWMKTSLHGFMWADVSRAHSLFHHHASNGNDPNMVNKDPRNVSPWMGVRREVGERKKEEEVQWQAVRGQRENVRENNSFYRSPRNRLIFISKGVPFTLLWPNQCWI